MNAETFNARYPVGTPVFAYPGARPEDIPSATRLVTRTRTAAQLSASGDPVVWVDGEGSYICLTHVDVVSEDEFKAARAAETAAAVAEQGALPMPVGSKLADLRARLFGFVEAGAEEGDLPSFAAALNGYVTAELAAVRAETAEFASRVNELESRICECEPVREHRDLRRPAFYQHAAHCPVNAEVSS